jgi:NitT/TauT family transport system permease protein
LAAIQRWASTLAWWTLSIGIAAGAWEVIAAAGLVNTVIWPPPHLTLAEIGNQKEFLIPAIGVYRTGAHFVALTALVATLERVFGGLTLATLTALVVGGVAFYVRPFGKLVLPVITMAASIAPVGWLPLALVVFGIGDVAATAVVFFGLVFVLTVGVVHTMQNVERIYIDTARILGASRTQVVLHVIYPAILPPLFVILRVNFLAAWIVVLAAEVLGVNTGLGAIIQVGRQMLNMRLMFLGMIMVGLSGFIIDQLFATFERRVLWWKPIGHV